LLLAGKVLAVTELVGSVTVLTRPTVAPKDNTAPLTSHFCLYLCSPPAPGFPSGLCTYVQYACTDQFCDLEGVDGRERLLQLLISISRRGSVSFCWSLSFAVSTVS
jgi:hypothetical protein